MWKHLPTVALLVNVFLLADLPTTLANNTTVSNTTLSDAANTTTGVVSATKTTVFPRTALYGSTTPTNADVVPEVVLTIIVIGSCGLLGLGIAKLGDYCYDRHMATRDDISNASEYTKNILRARLAVMKMKSDPPTEDAKTVKKAASAWIESTVTHGKDKPGNEKSSTEQGSAAEAKDRDVEKGEMTTDTVTYTGAEPIQSIAPPTNNAPASSPLPINKVSPVVTKAMVDETLAGTRANPLPPIAPRPKTPTRSINRPITSTR